MEGIRVSRNTVEKNAKNLCLFSNHNLCITSANEEVQEQTHEVLQYLHTTLETNAQDMASKLTIKLLITRIESKTTFQYQFTCTPQASSLTLTLGPQTNLSRETDFSESLMRITETHENH